MGRSDSQPDEHDQLSKIFDVIGTPLEADLAQLPAHIQHRLRLYQPRPRKNFSELVPAEVNDAGLSLLNEMVQFLPHNRISMAKTIQHSFFTRVRRSLDDGYLAEGPLDIGFNEENPRCLSDRSQIRAELREQIYSFHPQEQCEGRWNECITRLRCFRCFWSQTAEPA